ncbi:MAG: NADH-quinone oxidoreductase subunit NuoG [Alphaproteobacteria bacterium]|nr:NADH-quinone oxidoreductase subunit NuoG [Alphaproteobacteria bacterium]
MPRLIIDGQEIEVPKGITVLQACEMLGAEIPRFCFHERLSIAGNCRMCLVEQVGLSKLQPSCALSVDDLRPGNDGSPVKIRTNSRKVREARQGVMQFLLINHPLDCPICDQGGECDLQDQAMAYGVEKSRFHENKRAVEDRDIGPLVKTIMTRCIHCTRCIRFMTEVAGVAELGAIGRGEDMEIVTYLEQGMTSELQGNVIDLCPVGALTSRPYAFKARPWELSRTESIDVMDAVGSNIRVDTRGREVMRVLPRLNEGVNEEWISDKTRFSWDGLRLQRLDRPYIRKDGKLFSASWQDAFAAIACCAERTFANRIGAIAGDMASAEEMFAFKDLMVRLGVKSIDCRQDGTSLHPDLGRSTYLFNPTIEGIRHADSLLLIGTNPRLEASILNTRIRKRFLEGGFPIAVAGGVPDSSADLTYDYKYLGSNASLLEDIASGSHEFCCVLEASSHPMIMVGQGALRRPDGRALLVLAAQIAQRFGALSASWNGFSVLHTAASRVAGLDLGLVPYEGGHDVPSMVNAARKGALDLLFLLSADELDMSSLGAAFVVYIGSHGDAGASRADVILPGAAYTEKSGIYVNTEGRVQLAHRAIFPPGEAREDWSILRALSTVLGQTLPYDCLESLQEAMYASAPHLSEFDQIRSESARQVEALAALPVSELDSAPLGSAISDFYLSNPIARASAVMADLSFREKSRREAAGQSDA